MRRRTSKQYYRADERADQLARTLHYCIEHELGDATIITREDCLHLSAFQDVATITRYEAVRLAVRQLINSRRAIEISRTEFALAGNTAEARAASEALLTDYVATIDRLIGRTEQAFRVMDIVKLWRGDNNLTANLKRVAVRSRLRAQVKSGRLRKDEIGSYVRSSSRSKE